MEDEIRLELEGFDFMRRLPEVWDLLASDGHRFDHFSVGNTRRPLTHDPLGRLAVWTKKSGTTNLSIESADPEGASLYLTRFKGMKPSLRLRFRWRDRHAEGWLAWFESLVSLGEVLEGRVSGPSSEGLRVFEHGPATGWLFVCGGPLRRKLEAAKVTDFLARRKGGFVRRAKKSLIVGLAASAFDQIAGADQLTLGGTSLLIDEAERKARVDAMKLGRSELRRVLAPRGFEEVPGATRSELRFSKGPVTVSCLLEIWGVPTYSVSAHLAVSATGYHQWSLAKGPLARAKHTLTRGLASYEAQEARFLKYPWKFR